MAICVVAVDIGSGGPPSKFAWAAFGAPDRDLVNTGEDPETAVSMLTPALLARGQAALLLEAPMTVPVPGTKPDVWRGLGKARDGETNRPWSARAGAGALATGLAQGAWMLRQLAATVPGLTATTQPGSWRCRDAQLLLGVPDPELPRGLVRIDPRPDIRLITHPHHHPQTLAPAYPTHTPSGPSFGG